MDAMTGTCSMPDAKTAVPTRPMPDAIAGQCLPFDGKRLDTGIEQVEAAPARAGIVGGNPRPAKMLLESRIERVFCGASREGHWGWDGASLENVSAIAHDPLDYRANGFNLYEYVGDSPTNYTDPSGQASQENTPERKAACCKAARDYYVKEQAKNPKFRPPNGQVLCCFGEVISCNWFDDNHPKIANDPRLTKAHALIVMCQDAHEMSHLADANQGHWEKQCPCDGVQLTFGNIDQKKTECKATMRQIGCMKAEAGITGDGRKLQDWATFCGGDVLCELLLMTEITDLYKQATDYCGHPVPAPKNK
jgi:hypothetical protein